MRFSIFLLLPFMLYATVLKPIKQYHAHASVTDMIVDEKRLYAATDRGCIEIFDLKTARYLDAICVDKMIDFMGDEVDAKIFSVDKIADKILILAQAKQGFRSLYIYKNHALKKLISCQDEMAIAKAKFIDKERILLGLLSNELVSYDSKERSQNWLTQVSQSHFSDFKLNETRTRAVVSDESGVLHIMNTQTGEMVKNVQGVNLDEVFQVDFKNGVIATAGKDRRCGIYRNGQYYYKKSHFFIYAVGLSPSGAIAAYSSDEHNNVTLFDTHTREVLAILGFNSKVITKILFLDEQSCLVASQSNVINYYKKDRR